MGSAYIEEISYGLTAKEAYENAVADAESYYGHQEGYSGAINSTSGFQVHKLPEGITYGTKKFKDYLNKVTNNLSKFDGCLAIELPRKYWKDKEVSVAKSASVQSVISKGTRKWETVYGVITPDNTLIKKFRNKAEALKFAKGYSVKYNISVNIEVRKELIEGSSTVAKIVPNRKPTITKLKAYLFVGYANC